MTDMTQLWIGVGILLVLVCSYLYAIMPRLFHRPDFTPFKGKYFAHRGLHENHSDAPENSMKAFERAVEQGYGIELDVQLTKDLVPVVFHDYSLKRACKVSKKVQDLTYAELRAFHLFESQETIPLFEEVLTLVGGRVPLIVELKIPWDAKETCERTDALLRSYKGDYCVESFNPYGLIWYRKNRPHILRGQLSTNFFKDKEKGDAFQFFILMHLLMNFLAKPDFIAYHYIHRRALSFLINTKLFRAHAFAWTIRSEEALEESRQDFDCFIFDSFIPGKHV